MTITVRKIYRLIVLITVSFLFIVAGVCVNISLAPNGRLRVKANAVCTMLWSRAMCRILGIRVIRRGLKNATCGFAVCNHISYLDVFVLGSICPTSFLAKREVKKWPIMGWLATLGGTVFINRELKKSAIGAMREIERKVEYGVMVIIFPEGTTSDGRSIGRFKSTFFSVPARKNKPVIPISISYPGEFLQKAAWYGGMKLGPHFWNLLGLENIDAVLHFNQPLSNHSKEISAAEGRKRLCSLAYKSVAAGIGIDS